MTRSSYCRNPTLEAVTRWQWGTCLLTLGFGRSVLNVNHDVCDRRWGESCLIGGKPAIHDTTARLGVGDVNREIRNPMDPLHELKHRNPLDDYRTGRRDATLDDAVDLIVEMNEVFSGRNEEQIGLDQRYIEVPRKIPPKRGFADAEAAIDGDDDTRQSPHDGRQQVHDLQIGGKDCGHDAPDARGWAYVKADSVRL